MSDRKKIIIAIICMIIYVVMAVFFWSITRWVTLGLIISEYIAQVCRHKTLKIPAIVWAIRQVKGLKRVIYPLPLVLEKEAHIVPANLITSISILTLRDFKLCACEGNLNLLGKGTEDELKTAWQEILSQYYEVVDSDEMKGYIKSERDIAKLQMRLSQSASMAEVLKSGLYIKSAIEPLKKLYPTLAFTKESFKKDAATALLGEIHYKIQLQRLIEARDTKKTAHIQSPAEKRKELTALLMDISKIEGVRYDDGITVEVFATGLKRRSEYIKNLEEQNKR